jgi:hypothetical protein
MFVCKKVAVLGERAGLDVVVLGSDLVELDGLGFFFVGFVKGNGVYVENLNWVWFLLFEGLG